MNPIYVFFCLALWGGSSNLDRLEQKQLGFRVEICDNNIDDDEDGLIDVFDPDCQCPGLNPPNLVPNGQFSKTNGCCADLGQVNCLENWEVLGPSPDYISDNCLQSNLRPDVRFLSNALNTSFNDGYIFGLVHQVDGQHFTESMGVCLDSVLLAGQTYTLSFDIANLRNDDPDIIFSLMVIPDCNRLGSYNTTNRDIFCDTGLPFQRLATVSAPSLNRGWNTYDFEITPTSDIAAIFYSSDCDSQPATTQATFYMVLDNVSIREVIEELPTIEIKSRGEACAGDFSLLTNSHPTYTYQWYRDSMQLTGAVDSVLTFDVAASSAGGIYHVLITDEEGNCQLSPPYLYEVPLVFETINATICEGESYGFDGRDLQEAGTYLDTLQTGTGCDSIVELTLELLPASFLSYTQAICANDSLYFGDQVLSSAGIYSDTLTKTNGCDSIIQIDLWVHPIIETQFSQTICEGEAFLFGGQTLDSGGIYRDTLSSIIACDSIVILVLEVQETILGDTLRVEQIQGTTYDFHGVLIEDSGLYETILPTVTGCDSIVFLAMTFLDPCANLMTLEIAQTPPTCELASNGWMGILVEGGTSPFRYAIDGGENFSALPLFENLSIGTYDIVVLDAFDCKAEVQIILQIDPLGPPIIETQFSQTICEGEAFLFGGQTLDTGGTYRDTLSSITACDSVVILVLDVQETILGDTLRVEQIQGTTYDFHGTLIEASGVYETSLPATTGCDSIVFLAMTFLDPCANLMTLEIVQTPPTCELASNGWLDILVQGGTPPFRYAIDGGENFSAAPFFDNLATGTYDIVVLDDYDCSVETTLSIVSTASDLAFSLGADTVLWEGEYLTLAVEDINFNPLSYSWTSTQFLNCSTCPELRIRPTTSALYTLFLTDENGCTATDQMYVEINPLPSLYIPNVFSPNLDGINDLFQLAGPTLALESIIEMKIFSRWGDLVFQQKRESDPLPPVWDGTYSGRQAERGVYLYMISRAIAGDQIEILTGDVLLIR